MLFRHFVRCILEANYISECERTSRDTIFQSVLIRHRILRTLEPFDETSPQIWSAFFWDTLYNGISTARAERPQKITYTCMISHQNVAVLSAHILIIYGFGDDPLLILATPMFHIPSMLRSLFLYAAELPWKPQNIDKRNKHWLQKKEWSHWIIHRVRKKCHFICDYNSRISWFIFIFIPLETGTNTPQLRVTYLLNDTMKS